MLQRTIRNIFAGIGLALLLAVGTILASPAVAGAQAPDDYYGGADDYYGGTDDGAITAAVDDYYGGADDGYYGGGDADAGAEVIAETAAPEATGGGGGGTLPDTGGVAMLGLASAAALGGLALRRLARS